MKCSKCGNSSFIETKLSLRGDGEKGYHGKRFRAEAIFCTKCASVEFYANKEQIKNFLEAHNNFEKVENQIKALNEERVKIEQEVSNLRTEKNELKILGEETGKDYSVKIADLTKKINLLLSSKRKLELDDSARKLNEELSTAKRILDSFNSELIIFNS